MDEFDLLVPNFLLALKRWPEAPTLSNHYQAVVESYLGSGHSLIEAIKSFIECVCRTILEDFGQPLPSSDPTTTQLFVEALKVLGIQNTRGTSKIDKVLSAHNRLADALSEMRNENGAVAHGKDGFLDRLSKNHLRAYLLTADSVLSLILLAADGKDPDLRFTREPYERFKYFHERIDNSIEIEPKIDYKEDVPLLVVTLRSGHEEEEIELRIEPSRLLYSLDREAYLQILNSSVLFPSSVASLEVDEPSKDAADEIKSEVQEYIPILESESSYNGFLFPLKKDLIKYLKSIKISAALSSPSGANIVDSVLTTVENNMGVDWMDRENIQAKMKVALQRVLVQFGVSSSVAKEDAEHLISWFKIQAKGLSNSQIG